MNLEFFPKRIIEIFNNISLDKIFEIRVRVNYPIILLGDNIRIVLKDLDGNKFTVTENDIADIICNLTENSLYAYNDKLKNGYLTWKNGVRIGLCGECVEENGRVITIKNISSLNVRIPRNIVGCSNYIYSKINNGIIKNSLIISPPGYGKTTILKDLIRNFNNDNKYSILVIDERSELDVFGINVDVIKNGSKNYSFNNCIRSMRPDVVITDELVGEDDWKYIETACKTGVKVIATCHGGCIEDVKNSCSKHGGVFDLYFLLNSNGVPGKLKHVYDKNFNRI
ncbi:MAG: Flp pilus assembly complex ATPase component TadA [Clostridia bacterium]|nr:Flp pilus assembly complex ATPase component TadA [Clostridia bacterium]